MIRTADRAPARSPTITDRGSPSDAERWFLSSRAALIVVALLVTVPHPGASFWGGRTTGDMGSALGLGALWCVLFVFTHRASARTHSAERGQLVAGLSLSLDVMGLTSLLWVSGAAQNPFTLLYFVPITLATVIAQKWTFRIAGLSVFAFALLVLDTAVQLQGHRNHSHHAHFFQHVQGMALALAVAGGFVTLFVHRIARELASQDRRIAELSREREQNQVAVALGALSAGAAHELGSPLGSVQLLADELLHMDESERPQAIATIVSEVQRMKSILHGMVAAELSAEVLGGGESWDISLLLSDVPDAAGTATVIPGTLTTQPRKVVSQIVRELVRNANRVSVTGGTDVRISHEGNSLLIVVRDQGPGLSSEELARAQQPFVSYSGGTGLGLFLSTVHARQLGGTLQIESQAGDGTTVTLRLPLEAPLALNWERRGDD